MTSIELYDFVKTNRPKLIYISGKTSTGKSTFTKQLVQDFGYQVIELDEIVMSAVIKPLNLTDEGVAFVEVYRERSREDWIKLFVLATQNLIQEHIKNNEHLIVEGAVANPITLQELFSKFQELTFIYFHPKNIDNYIRNLTNRFMTTGENNRAGLPSAFWTFIDPNEFSYFSKSRVLTQRLKEGIRKYSLLSQEESDKRLSEFKKYFHDIQVLEI